MTTEQFDAELEDLEVMLVDLEAFADADDAERERAITAYSELHARIARHYGRTGR